VFTDLCVGSPGAGPSNADASLLYGTHIQSTTRTCLRRAPTVTRVTILSEFVTRAEAKKTVTMAEETTSADGVSGGTVMAGTSAVLASDAGPAKKVRSHE
jgi:hypothetical protein